MELSAVMTRPVWWWRSDSGNIQSEGCKRASSSLLTADPLKAMSGYMLGANPLETLLLCTPSPPGRLSVKIMHQEGCRSHRLGLLRLPEPCSGTLGASTRRRDKKVINLIHADWKLTESDAVKAGFFFLPPPSRPHYAQTDTGTHTCAAVYVLFHTSFVCEMLSRAHKKIQSRSALTGLKWSHSGL